MNITRLHADRRNGHTTPYIAPHVTVDFDHAFHDRALRHMDVMPLVWAVLFGWIVGWLLWQGVQWVGRLLGMGN